jgi:general secretion pathway protein F
MPVYEYTGYDASGKSRKGIIDADSPRAARQKLRAGGMYPAHLVESETTEHREEPGRWHGFPPLHRVGRAELVYTTRQLATLLAAGVPLVTALNGVLEQVQRTVLRRILSQVRERVNEGMSLAAALNEHPSVFPSTYTAMIDAGETSGTLELVMERLADFGEQELALHRKIRSALAYPLLMVLVGTGVVFFLMTYVIPRVSQIFLDMNQALPLPTVVLIRLSAVFQRFWPVLVFAALCCWLGGRSYVRSKGGRRAYHRLVLRLPIVGGIREKVAIARISRTLGTLLRNGVPLLGALEIVGNLVDNVVFAEAIDEARREISEGANITAPLARGGVFPPTVIQMISVGEQSGNLEGMLLKIAESFETDVENRVSTLASLLEPLLILALGVLVGFVVLAVLLPIFEMSHLVG